MRTRPGADEGGAPHDDAVGARLSMLSRALCTPLGVIAGFTELLPAGVDS